MQPPGPVRYLVIAALVTGCASREAVRLIERVGVGLATMQTIEARLRDARTDVFPGAGSTQALFGTPSYMAPEVLLGAQATEAGDVYSLGVMVYECLAGRRPCEARTIEEAIARIDDPVPPLDDPNAEIVMRMLANDPRRRPRLSEVARTLLPRAAAVVMPPPIPSGKRWPVIVGAAVATLALAIGGWRLVAANRAPASREVSVAPVTVTVAVAPFSIAMPSYGAEQANSHTLADTLAQLLGEVEGVRLTGVTVKAADGRSEAQTLGASWLVTGSLAERDGEVHAEIAMRSVTTGNAIEQWSLHKPSAELASLLDQTAAQVGHAIAPGAKLESGHHPERAQQFVQRGSPLLRDGKFTEARPYFEQAVVESPASFDGWYGLALILAWMNAPEERVVAAAQHAQSLATGPRADLMRGAALFLKHDYASARAVLEPLLASFDDQSPDRKWLLYYLGDANWHDGRHRAAFKYFLQAIELDHKFKPAAIHAWGHAVAHRDEDAARYLVALGEEPIEWVELAVGNYHKIPRTSKLSFAASALRGASRAELEAQLEDTLVGEISRYAIAVGAGDRARARELFEAIWDRWVTHRPSTMSSGDVQYHFESLGEVTLAAGLVDETRRLIDWLASQSTATEPARAYHRFATLAAPLLHDRKLLQLEHRSERITRLAGAIEAELATKHAKAAAELTALVDDPTFSWDYPERAALLRNLRAVRDRRAITRLCKDTLKPAIFRPAWFVLRRECR